MTYLAFAGGLITGFSLAVLLICRVSMRPKAKKMLAKAGLMRLHQAKVPAPKKQDVPFVEE